MRYVAVVSHGNSRAYNTLRDLQIYGSEVQVTKEDCVHHVAKRVGHGLKRLVEDHKQKAPIGLGRTRNILSAGVINKLQSYYK